MAKRSFSEHSGGDMGIENDGLFVKVNTLDLTISDCFLPSVKDSISRLRDRDMFNGHTLFGEVGMNNNLYKECLYVQMKYCPEKPFVQYINEIKAKNGHVVDESAVNSCIGFFSAGGTAYIHDIMRSFCTLEELAYYGY